MTLSRKRFGWLTKGAFLALGFAALVRIGFEGWPTIWEWYTLRTLAARLRDQNPGLARTAAVELVAFGPRSSPIFVNALQAPNSETRRVGCEYLRQVEGDPNIIGQALRETVHDVDFRVRVSALMYLGTLKTADGDDREADLCLQSLLGALRDDVSEVRVSAVWALLGFYSANRFQGVRGRQIATALGSALNDQSFQVRVKAAEALALLGPLANPEFPRLEAALDDPNTDVRSAAALALLRLSRSRHDAAVKTLARLVSETVYVNPGTDEILRSIHEAGAEADAQTVAIFLAKLGSETSFEGRAIVVAAIRQMGSNATSAIPTLVDLLVALKARTGRDLDPASGGQAPIDRELTLRCLAATAILAIQTNPHPRATEAILESIVNPAVGFEARADAVRVLCEVDGDARESRVLPALCKALGSNDQLTRIAAHDLLKSMEPGIDIDLNALFDKPLVIEPKDLKP